MNTDRRSFLKGLLGAPLLAIASASAAVTVIKGGALGSTTGMLKEFPPGRIYLATPTRPLRSRPLRMIFLDELDRFN